MYGQYIVEERQTTSTGFHRINSNTVAVTNGNPSRVFKNQLDKIWEYYFSEEGFPVIKHKFYTRQLFEGFANISPQLKLNILFNQEINTALSELTKRFQTLEKVLTAFQGSYFSKDNLYRELNDEMSNEPLARNLSNLLIAMYSENNNFGKQGNPIMANAFIQKRFNASSNQDEFRVINAAFAQVKAHI